MTNVPVLDESRPYGTVYGLLGAVYEQDGNYFNSVGTYVPNEKTETDIKDPEPEPEDGDQSEVGLAKEIEAEDKKDGMNIETTESKRNFEGMHWKHLKAMVEAYGEEWIDSQHAIEFLRGQKA